MGSKITYLSLVFVTVIEYFTVRSWFICKSFTDLFHHSSINLGLQINDYTSTEKGASVLLTRFFNNKLSDSILDLLRFYLQFWDIRFGASWFSLIGYFGIFSGFYYIFSQKKKRIYHWIMFAVIILLPWIEIIIEPNLSIMVKSSYLWLPFALFSLYGVYQFFTHGTLKKRLVFLFVLAVVSILWIYFLPFAMPRYCSM